MTAELRRLAHDALIQIEWINKHSTTRSGKTKDQKRLASAVEEIERFIVRMVERD